MSADPSTTGGWMFLRFGVIVTGKGERRFVDRLLRSLTKSGHCAFEVIACVGQLRPRTSPKHTMKVVGSTKALPSRDQELGLSARAFVDRGPSNFRHRHRRLGARMAPCPLPGLCSISP